MKNLISKTDKPIGLAGDHAGFEMKAAVIKLFEESGIKYIDFGSYSTESVDYPDFAHKLANAIDNGESEYGITFCGTGNGINMVMNKHQKVRSGLCWNTEIAELVRKHNNANALSMPARFISIEEGLRIVEKFFSTEFEGGRHQTRIDKIPLCK